jgi:hypothetical protein
VLVACRRELEELGLGVKNPKLVKMGRHGGSLVHIHEFLLLA